MGSIVTASYAVLGGLNLSYMEDSGVHWSIQNITGWGAPQGTISPTQKPRQAGAWAGTSYAQARSIVLTGTVYAPTPFLASDALDRLNLAASLDSTTLSIAEGGRSRFANVRRDGAVIESWVTAYAFTYSIQFVALDPRKFGDALTGSTFLPSSSGGLQWPNAWPESWMATTVSGTVSLTNPGNAAGSVILRIDGPASGPQIAHTSAANSSIVTFASALVLGAGEWLTVNMDTRQALANDQSNRAAYITNRGWSAFDPGVNVWSFSASSYNAASKLTVTAVPAWV